MKRKIWLLNHYASSMLENKDGRHYWFAKYLRRKGYEPVIFCCNARHNAAGNYIDTDSLWVEQMAEEIETPFVFVKARAYTGNGMQRVLNMMDFYRNVKKSAKEYAKENDKPDIILASSVHPLTLVAGLNLAKHFGVKCICEMRDLWPESFVSEKGKFRRNSFLAKLLFQGEKWIYCNGDALIFTCEGGVDYIIEKGWDRGHGGSIDINKVYHICNGVDLEIFEQNKKHFWLMDEDLDDPNVFKVVYTGSIRYANNLGIILDVAKCLDAPDIRFLIFGSGDELEVLLKRVEREKIKNVVFKGHKNKQYIPSIVSRADLNLVHYEMLPVLRYGESHNKVFEYFASGNPTFYTTRPGYSIVEKYHCGMLTEGFSPEKIAEGIMKMKNMPEDERKTMCENARRAADAYDFANLTEKLIEIIEKV